MRSFVKSFRNAGVLIILATVLAGSALGQALPTRVKDYMERSYPGWSVLDGWNGPDNPRSPAIASGDFNGDRKTDYAVVLKKQDRVYAIVMFVTARSIKAVTLEAQKESENLWVAQVSSQDRGSKLVGRDSKDNERKLTLVTDAINLIDGEGHSTLYYWRSGKFETLFGVDDAAD